MHWFLFHVWLVENQSQCHCSESITRNVQHKGLWEEAYFKKIYHKLKFTLSKMAVMQLFKIDLIFLSTRISIQPVSSNSHDLYLGFYRLLN